MRDGVAISGETGLTYTLTDADVGAAVSIEVDYTDLHGTAETILSAGTGVVQNVNDGAGRLPIISGTAIENTTLIADVTGLSDQDGLGTITFQWTRNGLAISGATGASYTLTNADVGAAIAVSASYVVRLRNA